MLSFIKWFAAPVAAIAIAFGAASLTAQAENKAGKGSVDVTVLDANGKAVSGANVMVVKPGEGGKKKDKTEAGGEGEKKKEKAPGHSATTDTNGKATIADLEPGDYVVNARVKGAGQGKEKVTVEADKTASVTITLAEKPAKK